MIQAHPTIRKLWAVLRYVFDHGGPWIFAAYVGIWIVPSYISVARMHSQMESQKVENVRIKTLTGADWDLNQIGKPSLIVFWATWCGPCHLELWRIQSMINRGELPAQNVLAVTNESDRALIEQTIRDREYTFPVAMDDSHELSKKFKVNLTPTLVVVGKSNEILWMTSGLSPLLETRLKKLFIR